MCKCNNIFSDNKPITPYFSLSYKNLFIYSVFCNSVARAAVYLCSVN